MQALGISLFGMIAYAINFVILVLLLRLLLYQPVKQMLEGRKQRIAEGLDAAERASAEAAQQRVRFERELEEARGAAQAEAAKLAQQGGARAPRGAAGRRAGGRGDHGARPRGDRAGAPAGGGGVGAADRGTGSGNLPESWWARLSIRPRSSAWWNNSCVSWAPRAASDRRPELRAGGVRERRRALVGRAARSPGTVAAGTGTAGAAQRPRRGVQHPPAAPAGTAAR